MNNRRLLRSFYILLGAVILLLLASPWGERLMLQCPLYSLTGWECPFCGTQRMVRALLHCRWIEALDYNCLMVVALPLFFVGGFRLLFPDFASRHPRITLAMFFTDRAMLFYVFLLLLWGILRNMFNL